MGSQSNGNINRNIRAALALIDMTKPYIQVNNAKFLQGSQQVEINFQINGCINITEVSVAVNDEQTIIATEADNNTCNYKTEPN